MAAWTLQYDSLTIATVLPQTQGSSVRIFSNALHLQEGVSKSQKKGTEMRYTDPNTNLNSKINQWNWNIILVVPLILYSFKISPFSPRVGWGFPFQPVTHPRSTGLKQLIPQAFGEQDQLREAWHGTYQVIRHVTLGDLVGGFNPVEKYESKWAIFPK